MDTPFRDAAMEEIRDVKYPAFSVPIVVIGSPGIWVLLDQKFLELVETNTDRHCNFLILNELLWVLRVSEGRAGSEEREGVGRSQGAVLKPV